MFERITETDVIETDESATYWFGFVECVYCGVRDERIGMVRVSDAPDEEDYAHYGCLRAEIDDEW